LSFLAGILVSQMSWIGRVGIKFVHPEYTIFKSWWQTGLLFFGLQLLLSGILQMVKRNTSVSRFLFIVGIVLFIGLIGFYVTFRDFQHTTTHRLLKERFHLGFYLFWICWLGTCGYFLFPPKQNIPDVAQN